MESSAATRSKSRLRRNSVFKSVIVEPQYSAADFKFISTKPLGNGYTSLKDILPSVAIQSPTAAPSPRPGGGGGYGGAMSSFDISIRNPLVKQAAWAYLQPMSAADGSGGRLFWDRVFSDISGCLRSMVWILRQALGYILRAIHLL